MGKHRLARPRRRSWLPVTALTVPVVGFLSTVAASSHPHVEVGSACCTEIVAAAPSPARYSVPAEEPPPAASPAAQRLDLEALPVGVAPERGLQVKTILAARAVSATFPEVLAIGGVRPDSLRWHPNGLAIDVMIPNYHSAEGRALGDRVVAFVFEHAEEIGLDHLIWRQTYYPRDGAPRLMADYGSDNANHYNHVHIATTGGGHPAGSDIYLR